MKKGFILLVAATIIIISGVSYSLTVQNSKVKDAASQSAHKIINVNELAANPAAYSGDIMLRGVVSGVNKAKKVIGIIDLNEFKSCGTLLCARYTLPVKYSGNPPALKSIVTINGRLIKNNRGVIIEARNIQVTK